MAAKSRFEMTLLKWDAAAQIALAGSLKAGKQAAARAAFTTVRTVERWYAEHEEFRGMVADVMREKAADNRAYAVALNVSDRAQRLAQLNTRWKQLCDLCDTGYSLIMQGLDGGSKETYNRGRELMANVRMQLEVQKMAAIELGEWQERTDLNFATMTDEQVLYTIRSLGEDPGDRAQPRALEVTGSRALHPLDPMGAV